MAREKAVVLTLDRDVTEAPSHSAFEKSELIGERMVEITYNKDRMNAGEVLTAMQGLGLGIVDVTTKEADLEDVFLRSDERAGSMNADVLIIGSGAAGLTAALQLAETKKVMVLAKRRAFRRRDRLGAGRDCGGARARRHLR